jgi:hypothetical protein
VTPTTTCAPPKSGPDDARNRRDQGAPRKRAGRQHADRRAQDRRAQPGQTHGGHERADEREIRPVNELDAWIAAACAELGLQPDDVQAKAVLDVARDVAHQVIRPGAPVSAYLMGVAVGRGADASDVAARLSALALSWPKKEPSEGKREPRQHEGEDKHEPRQDRR